MRRRRTLGYEDPVTAKTLDRMILHPSNFNGGQHKIALIELKQLREKNAKLVEALNNTIGINCIRGDCKCCHAFAEVAVFASSIKQKDTE